MCLLPLCSKLIYKRQVCWTRFPTKVKFILKHIRWYIPIIHALFTFYTLIHVFVFCCTFNCMLNANLIFWFIPLIAPYVYVRWCSRIRNPTEIKRCSVNIFQHFKICRSCCQFRNNVLNKLMFSRPFNVKLYCRHYTCRILCITKHIDIRRRSRIRSPTIIKFCRFIYNVEQHWHR